MTLLKTFQTLVTVATIRVFIGLAREFVFEGYISDLLLKDFLKQGSSVLHLYRAFEIPVTWHTSCKLSF